MDRSEVSNHLLYFQKDSAYSNNSFSQILKTCVGHFSYCQDQTRTQSGEACGRVTQCTFTAPGLWRTACALHSVNTGTLLISPWTTYASMLPLNMPISLKTFSGFPVFFHSDWDSTFLFPAVHSSHLRRWSLQTRL